MAKLSFTKLGLKPNNETVNVSFGEQFIEVKKYLPVEDKLNLISRVLELSHDSNNFSNPVKVDVYTMLEIIDKYTNINGDNVEISLYKEVDCFKCYDEGVEITEIYSGFLKLDDNSLKSITTPCETDGLFILRHE